MSLPARSSPPAPAIAPRAPAVTRQAALPPNNPKLLALTAALADQLPAETDETTLRLAAAQARLAAGDPAAALALAIAASARSPDEARAILGEAAWHTRAWDRVIEAYQPQLTTGLTNLEAAARLAIALEQVGRTDEAMTIHRAIADHPQAAVDPLRTAQRRLADLHERRAHRLRNDPPQAIAELEAALRLVPDHLPSLDALESIHADNGDSERVASILGRKIAATSRQPEKQRALLTRLADLQEQTLARPDVAKQIRKRIEELDRKP